MFEPNNKTVHCYGIMMPAIVYAGEDQRIRLRAYNMTERPVQLTARMNVGEVTEVERIESLVNLKEFDVSHEHDGVVQWTDSCAANNKEGGRGFVSYHHVFRARKSAKVCITTKAKPEDEAVSKEKKAQLLDKLEQSLAEIETPDHMKVICKNSTEKLEREQKLQVLGLLHEFSDIFAKNPKDIGKTTLITHDVPTGNAKPVCQAARRQSPEEYQAMKEIVEDLYQCGIIQPSKSQWASNIRMAKKKNGSWRMCIDYRDLNKRTIIHDPYPLPRIDAMIDALGSGRYFSCLDLISGYHQVPMTPAAQERTAFITPKMSPSHWEYKYMPFGLTSAPATFQRLVDTMLRGIQYDTCMAYIDDIIVMSATIDEGIDRLREVFKRIRMASLKLKAEKCDLFKEEITYLGHVISADGVKTDPKKVTTIQNYNIPMFVTDVRGFLGLCSYYRRFIKNFSDLTKPLNDLTKKDSDRCWREKHTKAFEELKRKLSETPVLAYPKDGCTYILDTDASGFAIGAVLSQLQPMSEEQEEAEVNAVTQTEIASKLEGGRHTEQEETSETDSEYERMWQRGYKKRPGCIVLQMLENEIRRKDRQKHKWWQDQQEEKRKRKEKRTRSVQLTSTVIREGGVTLVERPVAYASRMLLPREMAYCARRREFLAIYEMVQNFHHYLAGNKFILRTDHDSLKGVRNLAKLPGQFARWIDYLEGFQFEIQVRKGKDNANADFLSRMYTDCFCKQKDIFTKTPSACEALENEPVVDWDHFEACNKEMRERRIRNKWNEVIKIEDTNALAQLSNDQLSMQLKLATKIASANNHTRTDVRHILTVTRQIKIKTEKLGIAENSNKMIATITSGVKPVTTRTQTNAADSGETQATVSRNDDQAGRFIPQWTKDELRHAQRNDEELRVIYEAKVDRDGVKPQWNALSFEGLGCKFYYNQWGRIRVRQNLLYREWESNLGDYTRLQLIIPKRYQLKLIRDVHCTRIGNHQGTHRTLEFLRLRFFWYGMAEQIREFIKQCVVCQQAKILNKTPRTPMQALGAGFPNERVNVDFCGPFGDRESRVRYILVMCDTFTKFTVAIPTKDMTAQTAVNVFVERWINILGAPYEIHSDRGASFTAATWREFCEKMGIRRTTTTSYRPQANGQVERANRSILEMLRAMVTDVLDWDEAVSHICAAYNYTPHAAHGYSPYYLMFGRHPFSVLDVILPTELNGPAKPISESVRLNAERTEKAHSIAREKLKAAAEVSRRYYNRGHRVHVVEYEVGERAWLKIEQIRELGKLTDKFQGPYYVITKWESGTYRIARAEGEPPKIVHHDRMRKYVAREEEAIPDFIQAMIQRMNSRKGEETQTSWDDQEFENAREMEPSQEVLQRLQIPGESNESGDEEEDWNAFLRTEQCCALCKNTKLDEYGIYRKIFLDDKCHLCQAS